MILAIATDAMAQSWNSYSTAYSKIKDMAGKDESALVKQGTQAITQIDGSSAILQDMPPGWTILHPCSQRLIVQTLNRSWAQEVQQTCSRHAYRNWCGVLRIIRFASMLQRRIKLNNAIEAIKEIINKSWRGAMLRISCSRYLTKVKQLQRGLRSCVRLQSHIRELIILPMVWEVETKILGAVVG